MPSVPLPSATQLLVIGGGPAGSSAAWHAAQAGHEVLLLDRARFPRAKPCAEYVSPEGARILSAMGALDTLEQHGAPLTGMVVHAPSGHRIHGEFVARHGFRGFRDRGLGIRREVLDTVLLERTRAAGVHVVEDAKVEELLTDHRGRVRGARVRHDGVVREVRCTMVIGADGLRSVVSRRLGLARTSRWPRRMALVTHMRGVSGVSSLGEMHVSSDGYLGLASVGDDVTNVALVVPQVMAQGMAGDRIAFLEQWIARHPSLARRFVHAERVAAVHATGPFASRARRPWHPGAALVGDAADFFDPFTGEGIFAALRGGEVLAPFASDALRAAERGDHAAEHRALRGYDQERHRVFGGKWRVERLIGTAVAIPSLMNGAARVLGPDRDLADLLIGVTGDFVPASAVLAPRTVGRLVWAMARTFTRPALEGTPAAATPLSSSVPQHVHRP